MYIKWNKEKCQEEALKYKCRFHFKKNSSSAYAAMIRYNWLEEITAHMLKPYEIQIKWTKEKCQEEALKYNYKSDFRKNCSRGYNLSLKNKWLDEICSHMTVIGNKFKRCIYAYEFEDNFVYVGLTGNLIRRNNSHIKNYKKNDSQVFEHIKSTKLIPKLIQLTEYISTQNAVKLEGEYIDKYRNNGWNILNIAKAGSTGGNIIKWTKERCQEEALKYNNIRDFFDNSRRIYIKASKSKWLNDICSHMTTIKLYKLDRTKEKCQEEALKYESRFEFSKSNSAIYIFSNRQGYLDEICSHMIKTTKPMNYWNKEKCVEVSVNCKNKKQLQKKYSGAYNSARKNNWLNDLIFEQK